MSGFKEWVARHAPQNASSVWVDGAATGWDAATTQQRQKLFEQLEALKFEFGHRSYDHEHAFTLADDGFKLEAYDPRCLTCRLAALRKKETA